MVLKPEPIFQAVEWVEREFGPCHRILLTPDGERFRQAHARRLSGEQRLLLLCGRYEGIDERVAEALATEALADTAHGALPQDPGRRLAVAPSWSNGVPAGIPGDGEAHSLAWRTADIRAGLPQVFAASSGLWLPQNLELEALGGLSYSKGCYPGQEVVARLHYRGTVKQHLCWLVAPPGAGDALPAPGCALNDAGGAKVGELVDAVADHAGGALALAVVDAAASAAALYPADRGDGPRQPWQALAVRAAPPPTG